MRHARAMARRPRLKIRSVGNLALRAGAVAAGALALGALAIGAVAIGRLAIGGMAAGTVRLRDVEIEKLAVKRLEIAEPKPAGRSRVQFLPGEDEGRRSVH